ncbi:MAG: PorV/PorQ family protein [Ignavibacteria bacterium]|jgi:hypothetical protein|nr:PorV/PorQ family protein [Ignavibacteria bacterium]MCU7504245.1 PorV/PorQ family protein [Ignavibacteria bacterium]MCU7516090.1 PorV/PorQ family protein [Ignavibacteria bacterium]
MRFNRSFILSLLLLFTAASGLKAQGYMDFTNYPGSTSTFGMGEEGVALRNSQDAFPYNPANLAFSNNVSLSMFHYPFQIMGYSYPLNSFTAAYKVKGIGTFGFQYLKHDLGKGRLTSQNNPDGIGEVEEIYNYAWALGYAGEVTNELTMGLSLKYASQVVGAVSTDAFLFSGGLNYQPAVLNKRVNLGFSLMNMGGPIEENVEYIDPTNGNYITWGNEDFPVSSMMHLALSATPFENDYLSTTMQIGFSKYLMNEGRDDSKSSFSALFKDWKDFPRDARLSMGLSFEWKPLDLGNSFSFLQKYYLGSVSFGSKEGGNSVFTHGAEIGLGYKEISLFAGYSGIWHNVDSDWGYFREFPYESFQFRLEYDLHKFLNRSTENKAPAALQNILVSLGSGYNLRGGHLSTHSPDLNADAENSFSFSLESAFYMNRNNALVAAFYYTSIPYNVNYRTWRLIDTKLETVGIYSAYRYHPLEVLPMLYVQGGPGIERINPVLETNPKYFYQTSLNVATGANLDVPGSSIVVSPELNYQLMLVPLSDASSAPRLGGENQLAFTLKFGYRF